MKRLSLTLLVLAIFAVGVFAQDDPMKSMKTAAKKLASYNMDKAKNAGSLEEAKTEIDNAIKNIGAADEKNHSKIYLKAAEVYLDVSANANMSAKSPDALTEALGYYGKVAEIGKSYQKEEAKKGLVQLGGFAIGDGEEAFKAKKYVEALNAFEMALTAKEQADAIGPNLFLLDPEQMNSIKLYAGFSGFYGEKNDAAKKHLEALVEADYDEAQIYSVLFKLYQEDDAEKAFSFLDAGVKKYPGEKALLFDKINYYLQTKQMDKLEIDLKKAIDGDPENAQLPFTLGQVYEDLSAKSYAEEKDEDGDKYFNSALEYYAKTASIDPTYFDAVYQAGAIHFNRAVRLYKQRANLDMKEEGKYTALTEGINEMYTQAWVNFKKAELINASDILLVTAFKELYVRTNNNDQYTEYKNRLETLQADEKAELAPYTNHPAALFKK